MKIKEFKIRCSAIGKIMAGSVGLTEVQEKDLKELFEKKTKVKGLTEPEKNELAILHDKDKLTSSQSAKYKSLYEKQTKIISLTPTQQKKYDGLLLKKNNPELPEGAKTYCRDWLKGQVFNRQSNISTRFTEKGNIMEDLSIDIISEFLGYGYGKLLKNEDYYQDEFKHGTPDVLPKQDINLVIDAKNSWSWESFPLLETMSTTKDYEWQGQGYMDLTGRKKFTLAYVLTDTPEHLIERTARLYAINNGYEWPDREILNRFMNELTYWDIDMKLKVKTFHYDYDPERVKQIHERVELCRKYVNELMIKHNLK